MNVRVEVNFRGMEMVGPKVRIEVRVNISVKVKVMVKGNPTNQKLF